MKVSQLTLVCFVSFAEGSRVGEDEEVTWPHSVWFGPFPPPAFIPSTHMSCKEDTNFWTSQDGCGFGDIEQIF